MRAMILAAGLGTRMRPLTLTTPKPLLPVNGQPLISYHLARLARAGVRQVVINHAWLGEQIEAYVGDGSAWQLQVSYSAENPALETGGGIFQALDVLAPDGEPFLVINGDVLTDFPLQRLCARQPARGHLVMVPNPPFHPEGDFALAADGTLMVEPAMPRYTFAGLSVLNPALFAGCRPGAFPLAPLLQAALAQGQLSGELYQGCWIDVGTPERLHQAEQSLLASRILNNGNR